MAEVPSLPFQFWRDFIRLFTLILSAIFTIAAPAFCQSSGYWHTNGNQIVDSNNQPVRMSGVNWYGFELTTEVAQGLYAQDYKQILNTIKNNGYNVRDE